MTTWYFKIYHITLDGSSKTYPHVGRETSNLICPRHLFTLTLSSNLKHFPNTFFFLSTFTTYSERPSNISASVTRATTETQLIVQFVASLLERLHEVQLHRMKIYITNQKIYLLGGPNITAKMYCIWLSEHEIRA